MTDHIHKIVEAMEFDKEAIEFINKIDINVILSILKLSVHEDCQKGDIILSQEDDCQNLGFLLKGAIRSYYIDQNGRDMTKHFYIENEFFLDEVLFGYQKSICFYEALEDCEFLYLNADLTKSILYQNKELCRFYIYCLEHALQYKIARENAFLTQSATQRYLEFRKKYAVFEGRIQQSYIATYLGIKPESLSRIRKMLHINQSKNS